MWLAATLWLVKIHSACSCCTARRRDEDSATEGACCDKKVHVPFNIFLWMGIDYGDPMKAERRQKLRSIRKHLAKSEC
jgi:hypothetical protein